MGIMMRGACRCCDRTSPLVDHINMWCSKCANNPDYRKSVAKNDIIRFVILMAFLALVVYVGVK